MATILLINPSSCRTYEFSSVAFANPIYPGLSLAVLGGAARRAGHTAKILDLSYRYYNPAEVKEAILRLKPDVVGITATTPLANQLRDISFLVKNISKDILTIGGGSHVSALPLETMRASALDVIVTGEGDFNIVQILNGRPLAEIPGIFWRNGAEVVKNAQGPLVEYLDDLAMPAWDLYPIEEYRHQLSRILVRKPPVSTIEFSRGCLFKCDFCGSKNTMGLGYRKKSPERCAEEMAHLESLGYREALITDDIFTSNRNWAIEVCEAIIRRKLKIVWTCTNGIRVDSADTELFKAMRRAGCYRVHFGFESGNDQVLKSFGKGGRATLAQGITAVQKAQAAKLDTWGMYLVGLSADTESTMEDTIRYAKKTKVDVMKVGITIPFPGTPMFTLLHQQGRIKTYDWDEYSVYNEASEIFDHPSLSWEAIKLAYRKAYRDLYYLNPGYMFRRFIRAIKTGEIFWDIYYAIRFKIQLGRSNKIIRQENYGYKHLWGPLNSTPEINPTYSVPKAISSGYRPSEQEPATIPRIHPPQKKSIAEAWQGGILRRVPASRA